MAALDVFLATLRNPRWADSAHTIVELDGTMPSGAVVQFIASPSDPEPHGQAVLAAALRVEYGPIGAYVPPSPPTQTQLAATTVAACNGVGATVIASVEPTVSQSTAYATISSMVIGAGYIAPTTGPNVSRFNALASQFGVTPSQLASIVIALEAASIDINLALGTLTSAANAATTSAGLLTALTTFMTSISAIVTEVNAAVPDPISSPATPSIPGVNA